MSFRALRQSTLLPRTLGCRPLHSSTPRYAMKESDVNRDDLGNEYEAEKDDQVISSKEGKAKWKGELASNSEASVKADRGEVESDGRSFQEMQNKTKNLPNREGHVNKTQ